MSEQGALPGSPLPSLPLEAATAVTVCPLRALGAVPAASQGAHSASISYSKLSSQKVLRILATTPTASAPPAAPPGAPRHGDLPPRRVTRRTLCRYAACACARGGKNRVRARGRNEGRTHACIVSLRPQAPRAAPARATRRVCFTGRAAASGAAAPVAAPGSRRTHNTHEQPSKHAKRAQGRGPRAEMEPVAGTTCCSYAEARPATLRRAPSFVVWRAASLAHLAARRRAVVCPCQPPAPRRVARASAPLLPLALPATHERRSSSTGGAA